jgi:hypothetical protein
VQKDAGVFSFFLSFFRRTAWPAAAEERRHSGQTSSKMASLQENAALFLSFSYVCPEPVLTK